MMSSIRATIRSVSSTRVPTGARSRMMNWLSSDGGKNSVPMSGSDRQRGRGERRGCRRSRVSAVAERPAEQRAGTPSSSRSRHAAAPVEHARVQGCALSPGRPPASASAGRAAASPSARRGSEAKSEHEMVNVSGMKRSLAWPSRKTVGMKTTMVVIVDTKIGIATSRAASSTARRRGLSGILRCRLMFSSSTMESSTRRPTREGEPAEREDIERLPEHVHGHEREEQRERDGDRDDDGRDERAQEEQDDEEGQDRADRRLVPEALDGLADVGRLVERELDAHARRQAEQLGQRALDGVHDLDGIGARLLVDAEVHGAARR